MNERDIRITNRLERVKNKDVDKVFEVVDMGSNWLLEEKGFNHWSDWYTKERVEEKFEDWEVYLAYKNNEVTGTISISEKKVGYYLQENIEVFAKPEERALYISMMAVKPEFQNQGIASELIKFAESTAKNRGIEYVRFDCREEYTELVDFYLKREYKKMGSFSEEESENYLLMEKKI